MNDDLIDRIWQDPLEEPTMSQEQLIAILEPRVAHASRTLYTNVWAYLALQMGTLLLVGANLLGYRSNPVMLSVEIGIALGALAFAAYGVRLHGEIRRLERMDETFETVLRRRLGFYRANASTWMWLAAISVAAFTFALNSLVDNTDGSYSINHPAVFAGVQAAMILLLFLSFRVSYEPHLRQVRAVLADLEAQVIGQTECMDEDLQRWKKRRVALVVLLTAVLALGALMAWRRLP